MRAIACLIFIVVSFAALAQPVPLHKLDAAQLDHQIAQDLTSVERYRAGLAGTVAYAKQRSDLFRAESLIKRVWREEEKAVVRSLWRRHLDYQIALESIEQRYRGFWRIGVAPMRERAFTVLQAAHLTRYRHALDILEPLTVDAFTREYKKLLDEVVPSMLRGTTSDSRTKSTSVDSKRDCNPRIVLLRPRPVRFVQTNGITGSNSLVLATA